jgi:hypothetical protein
MQTGFNLSMTETWASAYTQSSACGCSNSGMRSRKKGELSLATGKEIQEAGRPAAKGLVRRPDIARHQIFHRDVS